MNTKNLLALELLNAVEARDPKITPTMSLAALKKGVYIPAEAGYVAKDILKYFKDRRSDVYKTFRKSWSIIETSSDFELYLHQIVHYFTTYGTNFESKYVYIPKDRLDIPNIDAVKFIQIYALSDQQIVDRCLGLLESGIALNSDTVANIVKLIGLCNHKITSVDRIKNKEALVILSDASGVVPTHPVELLRLLVYKITASTLLIKNHVTLEAVKGHTLDLSKYITEDNIVSCASIFNRFKPLWLALKKGGLNSRGRKQNKSIINKLSRLSKTHHVPMKSDVLNGITSLTITEEQLEVALKGVNAFRKMKVLNALTTRLASPTSFLYRVRNNRSFVKRNTSDFSRFKGGLTNVWQSYIDTVLESLLEDLQRNVPKGTRVKYPTNMDYGLPTSQKMFVGNIPVGTSINTGSTIAAGVYWKTEGGASDLDLSAMALDKVGWNTNYKNGSTLYSGDITEAYNGATELIYVKDNKLTQPTLVLNNIFRGEVGCDFNLVVGYTSNISANNMMTENKKIIDIPTTMFSKQQILGVFIPSKTGVDFVVLNTAFGNVNVSSTSDVSDMARSALFSQYCYATRMKDLLSLVDVEFVTEDEDFDLDLSYEALASDTLINLFT